VGTLAEGLTLHHPGFSEKGKWIIARHIPSGEIASAMAFIPWDLSLAGSPVLAAEQGIVGTGEKFRGQGLMRMLNSQFNLLLEENRCIFAIIQGIPNFYHKFGYYYGLELENHINLALHTIGETKDENTVIREAQVTDIPYFLQEDEKRKGKYLFSAQRTAGAWEYMFSQGMNTETAGNVYVFQEPRTSRQYYVKTMNEGFGEGLIISEMSENIPVSITKTLLAFLRQKAIEKNKPYLRFNLSTLSENAKVLKSLGAKTEDFYGWQVKIPELARFIENMKPVLQRRYVDSAFSGQDISLCLNTGKETPVLSFTDSTLSILTKKEIKPAHEIILPQDLAPPLLCGYRTRKELFQNRPDLMAFSKEAKLLCDVLFPKTNSWLYLQY
ncbi:MAG: GNAT family N-acetyltransferase, partial [Spirochaetia bacterium]